MSEPILLVGLGYMGQAYAMVLRELGQPVIAIGRSPSGVSIFENATGVKAISGGLGTWLKRGVNVPSSAIVCTTVSEINGVTKALLNAGVNHILIEKPGGTTPGQIADVAETAEAAGATVVVGYNRRFYASVMEVERRIVAEGGVTSFHFEFTERERDATLEKFNKSVQENWVLANSSHVIDLAFYLGGEPKRLTTEISGSLSWHPSGARFAGCGVSEYGAVFSYCANWMSGGRWGIDIMTNESRLILRPLEELYTQRRGSFLIEPVKLDTKLEDKFKPGIYRQTIAFLHQDQRHRLLDITVQAKRAAEVYSVISGEG